MIGNNYLLWENDKFIVKTPFNPHLSYTEGLHIVVMTKTNEKNAWEDPEISGTTFKLAAKVCQIAEELHLAPWFNIQSNGNWGLLPDGAPWFHVHIYGRNKTQSWGKPITLPEAPKTFNNEPMPEADRIKLTAAFKASL